MPEHLLEAWRTNNRINLLLLEHVSEEGMKCTLSKRGGRDVARQFAHLHNVRVWQLNKRAKDLAKGLAVFETKTSPSKAELRGALAASSSALEKFLLAVLSGVPKRRGFKKGASTTLAYFVAHESHHRGNILLTLKECGHSVDPNIRMGIWDWDRI